MRWKTIGATAVAGLLVVSLAVQLTAQERDEVAEPMVRVLRAGQGGYLGVFIADVSADDVTRLSLPEERGALITELAEEGPAREAGLQKDDVIVSWNGQRVESQAQLRRLLSETPAGRTVALGVFRGGSERSMRVELGDSGRSSLVRLRTGWNDGEALRLREELERIREPLGDLPRRLREMPHIAGFMAMRGGRLGVGIQSLGSQLGEYFGLGDRTGVLVTRVEDDSPAARAGLKAGDVIIGVDGDDIEDPGDVSRAIMKAEAGPVAIRILRERSERTVTVELPERENGTWRSGDGEVSGYFFGPGDFDFGEVNVEWVSPEALDGQGPAVFRFDTAPPIEEIVVPRVEILPPAVDIEVTPPPVAPAAPAIRTLSI